MLHIFQSEQSSASRGVPLFAPVMKAMHQLDGYLEAELVAARLAAAKSLFLVSPDGAAFDGDVLTNKAISNTATRTTDEIHDYIDEMTLLIEKNLDTNLDSSDLSESSFDQGELKNELANQLGVDSELIEFSATAG